MEYPSLRQISSTPGPFLFSPENPSVQHVKSVCSTNLSVQYKKPSIQHKKASFQHTDAFYDLNWRFFVLHWPFFVWNWGILGAEKEWPFCVELKKPFYAMIIRLYKFKKLGYQDHISFNFNKKFSREWQTF